MLTLKNSLSTISFCDKKCNNVNNNDFKRSLIELINDKYSINVISKFYKFLNYGILKNVTYNEHLLGTLTNGKPYFLFLTRIDNINCCFYIDTILKEGFTYPKIHLVKYNFNDELYDNTIFRGELVRDRNIKWFFLIDNILVYKDTKLDNKNIISKYELIYDIFTNNYNEDSSIEHCSLQIKKLFLYKDFNKLMSFLNTLTYKCRGLVFYSLNTKHSNYSFLFDRSFVNNYSLINDHKLEEQLKIEKPTLWNKTFNNCSNINNYDEKIKCDVDNSISDETNEDTIIFKVINCDISDIYDLYINEEPKNTNLIKFDYALIPNMKTSKKMNHLFSSEHFQLNMECRYSTIFKKWIPLKETKKKINNLKDIEKFMEV
jgi:hypothetical protein